MVRHSLGVPGYDEKYFGWKFSPRARGKKPLGLVVEDEGRVVGFASFFPYRACLAGRPGHIYLIADCVIRPERRGQGLFRKLFDQALERVEAEPGTIGTYLFSSADSDAIYKKKYGFRPIESPQYHIGLGDWKRPLAGRLGMRLSAPPPAKDGESQKGGLVMKEEENFDASFDRLWEKLEDRWPVAVVRDSEYLEWRFRGHPWHAYRLLTCRSQAGELEGYLVLLADSIHDFIFDGEASGSALLGFARKVSKAAGVPVVNCLSLGSKSEARALARAGFVRYHLPWRPFGLYSRPKPLVRPAASCPGSELLLDSKNWKFTFSDVDCGV
jgi:GNAT superfamily N-acetyltransferase